MSDEAECLVNRDLGVVDGEQVWVNLYEDGEVLIQTDNYGPGAVFERNQLAELARRLEANDLPDKTWAQCGTDSNGDIIRAASDGADLTVKWEATTAGEPVELTPAMRSELEAFLDDFEWVYTGVDQ